MPGENRAKADLGVMGLGVMGRNLVLNIADHGVRVAVWNRTAARTGEFMAEHRHQNVIPHETLSAFVADLPRPRRIILMIDAGNAVDDALQKLAPLLEAGDIVVDGGNSWYEDSERRGMELGAKGLRFMGMGVSGGEDGARFGPSLMPGGDRQAYDNMREVLEAISAKSDSGSCVTYIGPGGSGHFVKMVHNGIEYADMQVIAEAYDLLRKPLRLDAAALAEIFDVWNMGELESFLIEITAQVLRKKDDRTGRPLVDLVLDKAGQKGTGRWTVQAALALGVSIPSIAAAVDARILSGMKEERLKAAAILQGPGTELTDSERKDLISEIGAALYASKICAYAQGMALIQAAALHYQWNIRLDEVARIWKGGCIIRARILDDIMRAFAGDSSANLLLAPSFVNGIGDKQIAWRKIVGLAASNGIPVPCMSASLAYYDGYRSALLPQNLTQAQRDAFGAHTYQRVDDPDGGFIHSSWKGESE